MHSPDQCPPDQPSRVRVRPAGSAASAALVAVLTLLSLVLAPAAGAVPPRAAGTSSSIDLRLTRVSPTALAPGKPLVVTGTVRNLTGAPLRKLQVRLRLRTNSLAARSDIDSWLADGEVQTTDRTPATVQLKALAPGRTAGFTLTVPVGQSGLGTRNPFGARAIAVEVIRGDTTTSTLRSTIVWEPVRTSTRTRLSMIVPITATTPSATAGRPTQAMADEVQPGGRLQRLLDATSDRSIAWALDPALLASAARIVSEGVDGAGSTPTATPSLPTGGGGASSGPPTPTGSSTNRDTPAQAAARAWLTTIRDGRTRRGVYGLPFADPDLSSLLHSRRSGSLLRNADALGQDATVEALDQPVDTTIAWPGDGRVTAAGAEALAKEGRGAVILSASNQPPVDDLTYTPTGTSVVGSGATQLTGLLSDPQLSQLVAAAGVSPSASSSQDPVVSTQTLLAQLAAITNERPDDPRYLLAALPRTWDPNPSQMQQLMATLHQADWVSLRGVNELRAQEPAVDRADLVNTRKARDAELPIGQISTSLTYLRNLNTFVPALVHAEPVVRQLRESIAALLSYSWRSDRDDLATARKTVSDQVDDLVGGVRLLIGTRSKTLTARSAGIPLYVDNATPYPVRVVLKLVPESGQLTFDRTVAVDAPANARTFVSVPSRAIATGNVRVEGKLLTTHGKEIGQSAEFLVKVRPDWETWGLIGGAVILGLLLVLGLLRGIRRDRARVPIETVPDVDDIASRAAPPTGEIPVVPPGAGTPEADEHEEPDREPTSTLPRETR